MYSLADRSMTTSSTCVPYTAGSTQAITRDSPTIHWTLFGICFLIWSSTVAIFGGTDECLLRCMDEALDKPNTKSGLPD